jgi:hypothetical protein
MVRHKFKAKFKKGSKEAKAYMAKLRKKKNAWWKIW